MAKDWSEVAGIKVLASGLLVDATGRVAVPVTCNWLVQVASGNPEPDSLADCWVEVECGAKVRVHPQHPTGTICDRGHDRLPMEVEYAPFGPAWQREQAERADESGW